MRQHIQQIMEIDQRMRRADRHMEEGPDKYMGGGADRHMEESLKPDPPESPNQSKC